MLHVLGNISWWESNALEHRELDDTTIQLSNGYSGRAGDGKRDVKGKTRG